ncbi:COP9 signalosome complex subunit 6 [Cercospora zeina]
MAPPSLLIPGRPDTSLNVQLHPLVLLTISDYITRHSIRNQSGPAVGAILGQQNGRSFTLEVAYECKLDSSASAVQFDADWFMTRLEMYKEVHKEPALDLVALFTTGTIKGPTSAHLPILQQVKALTGSDSVMLLLFHPETVEGLQGGKLPISLYETVEEGDNNVKFRELAYDVETGDAERIGVDFVAKGGGTATAVAKAGSDTLPGASKDANKVKGKGKAKAKEDETETNGTTTSVLSAEDDELISSLQAKINAIKMLNERINLIRTYLNEQPQSYLTDANLSDAPPDNTNHQVLRSVQSMLSRLPLLAPPQAQQSAEGSEGNSSLQQASEKQRQDVHLTSLLASLTRSVAEAQTLGSKFSIVQKERQTKDRSVYSGGRPRGGFGEEALYANRSNQDMD